VQRKTRVLIVCVALSFLPCVCGWVDCLSEHIRYKSLYVEFDIPDASFVICSDDLGGPFISRGTLPRPTTDAHRRLLENITDPVWGRGDAMRIEHGAGGYDEFAVFTGQPRCSLDHPVCVS